MMIDPQHPTERELRAIDVHELLPQQEPFVMVSRLTHFDRVRTVTELDITPDNLMVDAGRLTTAGMTENIAQTCAARIGYVNKYILLKSVQVGLIGAIRDLKVTDWPCVGQTITTTVDVLEEVFGMTLAQATVACDGNTLVTAQMKIALQDEPSVDETEQ